MKRDSIILTIWLLPLLAGTRAADWAVYERNSGPGMGRHVVFLAGDEEYRSEEGLPMLAKILSQRHGFKCTVLFPIDKDGAINPNQRDRLPGAEALDSADAIVMLLRFRAWSDEAMKHFVDAYLAGKPIIALRTSTHAFSFGNRGAYKQFTGERTSMKPHGASSSRWRTTTRCCAASRTSSATRTFTKPTPRRMRKCWCAAKCSRA